MADIQSLIAKSGADAGAAVEVLLIAAQHFEDRAPLPEPLAKFLATAIRQAMDERSADRASALTVALGLTAPAKEGRRRLSNIPRKPFVVSLALYGDEISEGDLAKKLADEYGISLSTARRRIKETKAILAEVRKDFDAN